MQCTRFTRRSHNNASHVTFSTDPKVGHKRRGGGCDVRWWHGPLVLDRTSLTLLSNAQRKSSGVCVDSFIDRHNFVTSIGRQLRRPVQRLSLLVGGELIHCVTPGGLISISTSSSITSFKSTTVATSCTTVSVEPRTQRADARVCSGVRRSAISRRAGS